MDIIGCLVKIGLTRQESTIYTALCAEGEMTGYEVSKVCSISRSNAYLALAGLVEKGGAYYIESDVVKYIAVPIDEFSKNLKRNLDETIEKIKKLIPRKKDFSEPYITVSGRKNVINKMKNIIENAQERIYVSLSINELKYLEKELKTANSNGLKVVIITTDSYTLSGATIYISSKQHGQIRLIADSSNVLTGEINEDNCSCVYSKNRTLIQLIKDSLTDEIALINIRSKE